MSYSQWRIAKTRKAILKRLGKASNFVKHYGKYAIPVGRSGLYTFCMTGDANGAALDIALDAGGLDLPVLGGQILAEMADEAQRQVMESTRSSTFTGANRGPVDGQSGRTRNRGIPISSDGRFLD